MTYKKRFKDVLYYFENEPKRSLLSSQIIFGRLIKDIHNQHGFDLSMKLSRMTSYTQMFMRRL